MGTGSGAASLSSLQSKTMNHEQSLPKYIKNHQKYIKINCAQPRFWSFKGSGDQVVLSLSTANLAAMQAQWHHHESWVCATRLCSTCLIHGLKSTNSLSWKFLSCWQFTFSNCHISSVVIILPQRMESHLPSTMLPLRNYVASASMPLCLPLKACPIPRHQGQCWHRSFRRDRSSRIRSHCQGGCAKRILVWICCSWITFFLILPLGKRNGNMFK